MVAILAANDLLEEHPLLRVEATFMATSSDDVEVRVGWRRPNVVTVKGNSEHLAYGKLHQLVPLWVASSGLALRSTLLSDTLTV